MVRIASATGVPWATSTSTWRSLATISSGLCLFLDMDPSSLGSEAILQGGPLQRLTVTHIFLLWAKDLISLADPAALGGRARERTCSMKPVIGPRPSSGRPTLGMPDAPTVS